MESWYYLAHNRHAPAWNMACDEWLLIHARQIARPVLRTYGWDRPSATIGYFQPFPADLPPSLHVVRRITGGALVVHDSDLTFSVVLPPQHPWRALPTVERYRYVHERVRRLFESKGASASLAGVTASPARVSVAAPSMSGRHQSSDRCFARNSRHDVLIEGMKAAGGAQRVTRDGLLHQGSIQTAEQWRPAPSELRGAWESFGAVFTDLKLTAEEEAAVAALAARKFATREWNQHGKFQHALRRG